MTAENPDMPVQYETAEERQRRRQPTVNHEKPGTIVAWDPRLALELVIAGQENAMQVFERYKIDKAAAIALLQNPLFVKQVADYKAELEASGMGFRMKARVLAEDLLPDAYDIAKDPLYPASVRADMIQWMTKVADLEPVRNTGKDIAQTGGFSLQILFAGQAPAVGQAPVVEGQVIEIRDTAGQTVPTNAEPHE